MSSELATYVSGRYITINVKPLSYKEFLYFNKEKDSADAFQKFLTVGGFPGLKDMMEKYYFADQGLLFLLHGYRDSYINGILENILFTELLRRSYAVYIGKAGDTEIDFVAVKGAETIYVQVAYLLSSEEARTREYRPLRAINDNYAKLILTMDNLPESNDGGIIRKNIREWLLTPQSIIPSA